MTVYSDETRLAVRNFRKRGLTYTEIQKQLGLRIPKGTLSYMCRDITLSHKQSQRISKMISINSKRARQFAVIANRKKFESQIEQYKLNNSGIATLMSNKQAKLVALSMLYLGEGAKWPASRAPKLGSSNPLIIRIYIDLLRQCYGVKNSQLRCSVQHRADQNSEELVSYWSKITNVPKRNFYPSYIDKRTIGRPTRKTSYRGVCSVGCTGTHIQLELEQIAGIISEALRGIGAAG